MFIPVNSIMISSHYRRICSNWNSGLNCMMYAISSTGGLTTGTTCPISNYTDQEDRNRKWYYLIWCELASDVGYAARLAGEDHEDYAELKDFQGWADEQVERLYESYGLEDWDDE